MNNSLRLICALFNDKRNFFINHRFSLNLTRNFFKTLVLETEFSLKSKILEKSSSILCSTDVLEFKQSFFTPHKVDMKLALRTTYYTSYNNKNKKKGIVLLSTLMSIILITGLIAISFQNFQRIKDISVEDKTFVQTNLLLMDTIKFIKKNKLLESIENPETLQLLIDSGSYIPMTFDDYSVLIKIKNDNGKFNINTINILNSEDLFSNIQHKYGINDIELLQYLIKHAVIDKKNKDLYSDIEMLYPYAKLDIFGKGKIYSIKHFNKILDFYVNETRDTSVYNVPWENILRFSDPLSLKIDINYMSDELIRVINPSLSDEKIKLITDKSKSIYNYEEIELDDNEKDIFNKMNVSFFEKELKFELTIMSENYSIKKDFYYNIDKKRVYNFK